MSIKKEIITLLEQQPKTLDELKQHITLDTFDDTLERAIEELVGEGLIWCNDQQYYMTRTQANLVCGVLRVHEKGYAFLDTIGEKSIVVYIAEKDLSGALHGDKVLVKLKKTTKNENIEGKVVDVMTRSVREVVGTFFDQGITSFITPDDHRLKLHIAIEPNDRMGAVSGHKVVAEIISYNPKTRQAQGIVRTILGHKNDPGVDILSIVYQHGLPIEFSEEAMAQANALPETIESEALATRRDLRDQTIVTIDGEDAKDLDDAVSVEKLPDGTYKLGVHIADVSHYIQADTPLDHEAYERGTSVYLVDRVIPMIPHRLSNGLCSLNPKEDRLTLSCEMIFSKTGDLLQYDLFESIIRTTERMTYTNVRKIIQKEDPAVSKQYASLVPMFEVMAELSSILREQRMNKGAIDFDVKEGKVVLDDEGHTQDIVFRERSVAEKIIEDFMLAANETVAHHFAELDIPFLYRIHDEPHTGRLLQLIDFIASFGHRLPQNESTVSSSSLQHLLTTVKSRDEGAIISRLALRTMQQAKYTPENCGHYGLAMTHYTHFTSPIRRYPDLVVHRLVKEWIHTKDITAMKASERFLPLFEIGEHTSQRERRAVEAERDTLELKKAEYMEDKVGTTFDGIISSVTKFGFFVELPNTIEGLVHVKSLADDHYRYDEKTMRLIGKKTKQTFTIGEHVRVKLVQVDVLEGTIDFEVTKKKKTVSSTTPTSKRSRKDRYNRLYNK